jgi:hypothetical protein
MPGQPGCRRPSVPGPRQFSGLLAAGPEGQSSGPPSQVRTAVLQDTPRARDPRRYGAFCHTEMWRLLSPVNGARCQSLQRSRNVIPASRAIRSSSDGQT